MKKVTVLLLLSIILVACGGATPTPDISAIQTQAVQDAIATMTAQVPSPTVPATATKIRPTPTPDEIAQAKNIALKLDELPGGWYEASLHEQSPTYTSPAFYVGGDVRAAVRVIYRNKKYAAPEEEISVANDVYIYDEPEAARYCYSQEDSSERRELNLPRACAMQEIRLGDGGFYVLSLGEPGCGADRLMFVSNSIFVRLEYYGSPLQEMDSRERLRFLWQLAEAIAKRAIPDFSSMPPFPEASPFPTHTPTPTSVPTALPPSPAAPPTGGQETYVVQFGDTLATIAEWFDTTVDALAAANGLTYPYVLYVGQNLIINPPPPPLVQSLELTTDLNYGSDHVEAMIRVANRSPVGVDITLQVKTVDADGTTLWSDSFTFEDIAAGETLRQDLYLGAIQGGSRIDKVQTAIVWAEQTTIPPASSRTDIQLLTQMPILVDDYSSIIVRLRNTTNEYKFAPIMVKYYWSDGSLRLRSYGELGPLGPGETREFRISPTVLSGGHIYAHIYLLD